MRTLTEEIKARKQTYLREIAAHREKKNGSAIRRTNSTTRGCSENHCCEGRLVTWGNFVKARKWQRFAEDSRLEQNS